MKFIHQIITNIPINKMMYDIMFVMNVLMIIFLYFKNNLKYIFILKNILTKLHHS